MDALVRWFESLEERERRFVAAATAVAAAVLLLGLLLLDRSVVRAQARLAHREQDLAWMRSVAPQLAAAGPATVSAPPASQRSLIAVVDAAAHEVGLGTALSSSTPSGKDGLRVRLDKAPFDTVVGWLARLSEQHGIHVQSATIDSAGAPGIVNAGIVLRPAR